MDLLFFLLVVVIKMVVVEEEFTLVVHPLVVDHQVVHPLEDFPEVADSLVEDSAEEPAKP